MSLRWATFKNCEGFIVAAALQAMGEPRIHRCRQCLLENHDSFGSGLETIEMCGGILIAGGVVRNDRQPFPKRVGEL